MKMRYGSIVCLLVPPFFLVAGQAFADDSKPVTVINTPLPVQVVNPGSAPAAVNVTNTVKTINQDEPARHPYQETAFANCRFAGDCASIFSAVPAGVRRVITHVSCAAFIPAVTSATISGVGFLFSKGQAIDMFPVTLTNFAAGQAIVEGTASQMTLVYAEAGDILQAHLTSSGVVFTQLLCALSGYDVSMP